LDVLTARNCTVFVIKITFFSASQGEEATADSPFDQCLSYYDDAVSSSTNQAAFCLMCKLTVRKDRENAKIHLLQEITIA